jgi:YidC/Oxa1 family membrane protein insertase
MDREEVAKKEEAIATRASLAPKPGQKPVQQKRRAQNGVVSDSVQDAVPDEIEDAVVTDAKPATRKPNNGRNSKAATQGKRQNGDPRRAVKPTVPNPNANKPAANKPAPGVRPNTRSGAKNTNGAKNNGAANNNRTNGAQTQDGTSPQPTNGKTGSASEIPGLISDRSRRKKPNRKR